jgi:hypothetical protein
LNGHYASAQQADCETAPLVKDGEQPNMTRIFTFAAVVAALATPALAESSNPTSRQAIGFEKALMNDLAQANTARQILSHQGYVNISTLQRDADSRWTGTAYKDGKLVSVAIFLPPPQARELVD